MAINIADITFLLTVLYFGTCVCQEKEKCNGLGIGEPDSNILTRNRQDDFIFTAYPPPSQGWGDAKYVADEHNLLTTGSWTQHGVMAKCDGEAICSLTVNLRKPHFVRAFAVTGYAGGSYKPTGSFFLEGSNDGNTWRMVAEGKPEQWHAPGTYPFRPSQIVKAMYPGRYQFYRVIAKGWTNGHMLVTNWGLFA